MNPSVPQRLIDAAMERDSAAASSEWLAEFRNDIAAFVPREVVESCVDVGERERPWDAKHRYTAFVDPSGGSSDSMTIAVGHREKDITITDVVREIPAVRSRERDRGIREAAQELQHYDRDRRPLRRPVVRPSLPKARHYLHAV
jgi:hypothetical protein